MPTVTQPNGMSSRTSQLQSLLARLEPVPAEWFASKLILTTTDGSSVTLEPVKCESWKELVLAWRKAMKWTEGLERGLAVMLACITSTRSVGSQLWVKIIGPPSCGKTTLCEALTVNLDYVIAKSTIRGFYSGYKMTNDPDEDNSLINKIKDKTMVTKDGDALMKQANIGQILGEARDVFDTNSRSDFKNNMGRDYQGIRATWILCGTRKIKGIDDSELGERFLDCIVMEGIDDDEEDDILWRVVNKADRNLALESDGSMMKNYEPDLINAMQLTAGYVTYLRENARNLLERTESPEEFLRLCTRFGKLVAYMRARPSRRGDEDVEREFAARLVEQHWRLAKCLAVVFNKDRVDKEVMNVVHHVAMATAKGQSLEIAHLLHKAGDKGMSCTGLANHLLKSPERIGSILKFMRRLNIVEPHQPLIHGVQQRPRWKLTPLIHRLYRNVMVDWHD